MAASDRFLPGRHAIESYGAGGFRFADMSHQGSLLILPSGVRAWSLGEGDTPTLDDLALALQESAALDLMLVGTGIQLKPLGRALLESFAQAGIGIEAMPTATAARTYNVLLAENRRVGAALIAVP